MNLVEPNIQEASIQFMPVCSNCGMIFDHVEYGCDLNVVEGRSDSNFLRGIKFTEYTIKPMECPRCGVIFRTIIIPTKFPYDRNKMYG